MTEVRYAIRHMNVVLNLIENDNEQYRLRDAIELTEIATKLAIRAKQYTKRYLEQVQKRVDTLEDLTK